MRDPFEELQEELVRSLHPLGFAARGMTMWFRSSGWQPLVDLVVSGDRAWVRMDVAGVAEEDLSVRLEGTVLVVRGIRRPPREHAGKGFYRAEIFYGSFERRLTLPWRARCVEDACRVQWGVLDLLLERAEDGETVGADVRLGGLR